MDKTIENRNLYYPQWSIKVVLKTMRKQCTYFRIDVSEKSKQIAELYKLADFKC